ncbi:MAG: hypothetical protein HC807_08430 [Gammaproteobacteria bacterium]|nr:hypothetical protein [Gammaproteobacteria bacterium]
MFVAPASFRSAVFNDPTHAKENRLLLNNGDLTFTDITAASGTAGKQNTFLSVFVDLDADGWQDLVVAQNTGEVEIFRNMRDRTFRAVASKSGYGYWMSLAVGDIDNDGDQDLFFSNVGDSIPAFLTTGDIRQDQRHNLEWLLLRNDGGFRFTDATRTYGLTGEGFAWGAVFEDLNLDGQLDLFVAQNYIKWPVHKLFKLSGRAYLQRVDGGTRAFRHESGLGLANKHYGQSPLIVDIDGDGRQDLIWLNMDGPARAFLNRSPGDYVTVVVPDTVASLGTRVSIETANGRSHTREVVASAGMLTDQTPELTFGVAAANGCCASSCSGRTDRRRSFRRRPSTRGRSSGNRARTRPRLTSRVPFSPALMRTPLTLLVVSLAGCVTLTSDSSIDQRFGVPDPTRYDKPASPPAGMSFRTDVQPILERRCVVCHGCYDAPCQIKLGAWEGIARGSSNAMCLRRRSPGRGPADAAVRGCAAALRVAQEGLYRHPERASADRGGQPCGERAPPQPRAQARSPVTRRRGASQAVRFLARPDAVLPDHRAVRVLRTAVSAGRNALRTAGARPARIRHDHTLDRGWRALRGFRAAARRRDARSTRVGKVPQRRLAERAADEPLSVRAPVSGLPVLRVRSGAPLLPGRAVENAPGEPVAPIATRRPYDDPGVPREYYRLVPERETIIAKTHMPYALSPERMAKFRTWFLAAAYEVSALPSYAVEVSTNPFVAFRAIPPDSRYRFLLDEAQYFIMNFIKGPVCRGQLAVDVIEDHFWVFFVDPVAGAGEAVAELTARESVDLRLPAEWGSDSSIIGPWLEYAKLETRYLQAKSATLDRALAAPGSVNVSLIWNGGERNRNAALTVFRHFDSASVVKGMVGAPPKTAWVIGYPLFERIYYLLVTGYDVYGDAGHQLNTRLYMDFLRMEGEFNFLVFLPRAAREATRDYWYRGRRTL